MKIIIDELEYNKLGKSLFGKIYITSEGFDFPGEEWTDFVFPILGWWANELTAKRNTSRQLQMLFMDGSFEMTGEITGGQAASAMPQFLFGRSPRNDRMRRG